MSPGFAVVAAALAHIPDFSDRERQAIVDLLSLGRAEPGHPPSTGRATQVPVLGDRAFTWSEFDRWHAFFSARGTFPARWEGLQFAPASGSSPEILAAYRQRKLRLLVEWLEMLAWQTAELDRYTRQGLRVRMVRQEDGHRCPACESVHAHEVSPSGETRPPLHPGCRCVLMALTPDAPHARGVLKPRRAEARASLPRSARASSSSRPAP